jgi:hypothetical protein
VSTGSAVMKCAGRMCWYILCDRDSCELRLSGWSDHFFCSGPMVLLSVSERDTLFALWRVLGWRILNCCLMIFALICEFPKKHMCDDSCSFSAVLYRTPSPVHSRQHTNTLPLLHARCTPICSVPDTCMSPTHAQELH